MIYFIRTIHGLISFYFVFCIAWIYYSAISNWSNAMAYVAVASIILEGLIVLLNHGDCPLGVIHHHFGDDKAFFELFLPKPVAKKAVPVLVMVGFIGMILLVIR